MEYRSNIDEVLSLSVRGWATVDQRGGQRLTVQRNKETVATITADQQRPDLSPYGLDVASGFNYTFDHPLRDGEEVSVLFESGEHLVGSPTVYRGKPFGPLTGLPDVTVRAYVAAYVLQGSGIEIGALHRPLRVPDTVQVQYVDRYSADDLRQPYPELAALPLADP